MLKTPARIDRTTSNRELFAIQQKRRAAFLEQGRKENMDTVIVNVADNDSTSDID
jgi:hypothetical protein